MGKLTYIQVENAVVNSALLSGTEKLFYMVLKSFRNRKSKKCFPSIRRVAERAGMSKDTAYHCRERLGSLGLIEWCEERGRKHSCHYRFNLEDGTETEVERILEAVRENKIAAKKDSLAILKEGQGLSLI